MCLKILFLFSYFKMEKLFASPFGGPDSISAQYLLVVMVNNVTTATRISQTVSVFSRIIINPPLFHNHILFICHRLYMTSHNDSFYK